MKKQLQMHDLKFKLILVLIAFISISINAQDSTSVKQKLQTVTDIEMARNFIKENRKLKSKIYTYNQEKHTNDLSKKLFTLKEGETLLVEQKNSNVIYKVISITPTKHYRASYIFFNGKKMAKNDILNLRVQLKSKLNNGSEFKDLAGQYSMDRNASRGGDLGWFQENYMFPEFITSLENQDMNDIFFLDLETKKKYYLIQKTANSKDINLLTVLKVTL
jgi:parvulin-like peptidyl-prolyl isomerase